MLSLLITYRVKESYGPSGSIPYITGLLFNSFVEVPNYTVALFSSTEEDMSFANYAIEKNQNKTVFIRASEDEGNLFGCKFYPCAVMLKKGKYMSTAPILRPIPFYQWIINNLYNTSEYLNSTEALREVFEGFKDSIFSVDEAEKPATIPEGVDYYKVSSHLLSKFRINVEKGNYIYTPSNRNFVECKGKVSEPILRDPRKYDMTERDYFAGYVIDNYNDKQSEKYVQIMENLAAKYKDNVSFSVITGANAAFLTKTGEVESLDPPFFMVFDTRKLLDGRWLLYRQEDDFDNETAVDAFIGRILEGKEEYTIVSEPIPEPTESPFEKIVGYNFAEKVFSTEHDSVVAFVADFVKQSEQAMLIMNETAILFKDRPVRIYWMDGSVNDAPKSVPSYERYPTIMMWPAGNNTAIVFSKLRSAKNIVNFIETNSALNVTAPPHNPEDIDNRVSAILHPKTAKAEKEFKEAKKAKGEVEEEEEADEVPVSPEEEALMKQIRDITAQALKEVAERHNTTAANTTSTTEEIGETKAEEEEKKVEEKNESSLEEEKKEEIQNENEETKIEEEKKIEDSPTEENNNDEVIKIEEENKEETTTENEENKIEEEKNSDDKEETIENLTKQAKVDDNL